MSNNAIDNAFKSLKTPVKSTANFVAVTQISINLFVSLSMSLFIGVIDTLNVVCFSSMFKQDPPPNKELYNKALVEFLGAEVIDPSWTTELIYDFDTELDLIDEMTTDGKLSDTVLKRNIYDLGFEQFDPILNTGGLYIMFFMTLGFMTVSIICKKVWSLMKIMRAPR